MRSAKCYLIPGWASVPVAEWDVVIIGAGIHGAGIAQAAAAAGHSVLVLEQQAPASGTSSRSSKLIHGGLRYLESADFLLVRESLHERELLLRLAPKLVQRQKFYLPVYKDAVRGALWIRAGLTLYALLAGLRAGARYSTVPRQQWASLDGLRTEGLEKVYQYWDAQTDDAALTRAVLQSARQLGAAVKCPARFMSARIDKACCEVVYVADGVETHTTAHAVVNAAGPWADQVARQFSPALPDLALDNIRGTHIELSGSLTQGCYYLEVPSDKRAVFALSWQNGRTLFGTTETAYRGDPADVQPLDEEVDYLTDVYRHYFPQRAVELLDAWAGLRVLPAVSGAAFKRSRETHLATDKRRPARVVCVYGGKLTVYRATAQKALAKLVPCLPRRTGIANTAELTLEPDPAD